MQSSWTHQVKVTAKRGRCITIYCYRDGDTLRAVGDCATAPGQRVAVRRGNTTECVLGWAAPSCRVQRRPRRADPLSSRIVVWTRNGDWCYPAILTVTEEDAQMVTESCGVLAGRGVLYPASRAPYRRMASLSDGERDAYHAAKKGRG
jgi:hypothetical protein